MSVVIALCLFVLVPSAAAETGKEEHTFDALLSLTGGTGTSKVDSVADPGSTHPPGPFRETCGVAIDTLGYEYVASYGGDSSGEEGRIDIFNPAGEFVTEIENEFGPCDVAVDSTGVVYAAQRGGPGEKQRPIRYTPSAYPPTPSVTYGSPTVLETGVSPASIAIDPSDDHVYLMLGQVIREYSSAAEGNVELDEFGSGTLNQPHGLAVDSTTGDVYAGSVAEGANPIPSPSEPFVSVVYIFGNDHELKGVIDGSDTPAGGFASGFGQLFPAVDEDNGEVFVADVDGSGLVYRYVSGPGGLQYLADPELEEHSYAGFARIAVSNADGATNFRHVYVASSSSPISHVYAFAPESEVGPPIISNTGFSDATTTDVLLVAEISPNGAPTSYSFEYVDDQTYQRDVEEGGVDHGFDNAASTPTKSIGGGTLPVNVVEPVTGLSPGTTYHFRLRAFNECEPGVECVTEGEREGEGAGPEIPHVFATFPQPPGQSPCPNDGLRVGPSAALPDCRAYELVSVPHPAGHFVTATPLGLANAFPTQLASPDGESAIFTTRSGAFPGYEGNGYVDLYRSTRGAGGWSVDAAGPTAAQTETPRLGGVSADHGYSAWTTGGGIAADDEGSLVLAGGNTTYIRYPDGSYHLLGAGSIGTDNTVALGWIAPGGSHIIFKTPVPLAEGAPPNGTTGIYDRTSDGELHVVSLLPGDLPVPPGGEVKYKGASHDGSTVAFTVKDEGAETLYLRIDNIATLAVDTGTTFAGLSGDGRYLFYLKAGNIFTFAPETSTQTQIGVGGASILVHVSPDGSHVYFISPKLLDSPGPAFGKENLYVWDRGSGEVKFIATVLPEDVAGEPVPSYENINGLGLWLRGYAPEEFETIKGPGVDSSRTSPDGRYLVFMSRANLTAYDAEGRVQIYRYDSSTGSLLCVSCRPDLAAPSSDADLETLFNGATMPIDVISNVTADGRMVFFHSDEPLVPADSNGIQDVYEWEVTGSGGCVQPKGCISLISDGRSSEPSELWGVGTSGRDVFFTTPSALAPSAEGGTPSIYDARIGGGFAPASPPPQCELDDCQQTASPPAASAPSSSEVAGPGNVKQKTKKCRKNQRKVRRHGKVRCVSRDHRNRHPSAQRREGRR